jgi:hypothetical protein
MWLTLARVHGLMPARRESPANNIAHGITAATNLHLLTFITLTLSFACLAWMQDKSSARRQILAR